ncbi:Hypothetical protein CINCED_3A020915 [Cinara cedri]|uniref:Uncharacterized protein n=1 Tax=Cinara cedri TaxID=506608 RepID=A0A5E4M0S7_9HEMI|nr:Hypothetical protein CINCED_3A020915 [Cinara cedri]
MSAEKYLSRLEDEESIKEPLSIDPPVCSSFYWKNYFGRKHKVFMPTPNRQLYYNLEEYDVKDIKDLDLEDRKEVKKCLCLAVSDECAKDRSVITKMNKVMKKIGKRKQFQKHELPQTTDDFSATPGNSKYYTFLVYSIKNVNDYAISLENRFEHTIFCERISISSAEDKRIGDAINAAFRAAAKRFANDSKHEVFHYNRYD